MELSRELIIDALLNVAAYVTAGALWLVIYSIVTNRSRQEAPAPKSKPVTAENDSRASVSTARRVEFVSLAAATGPAIRRVATPRIDRCF